MKHVLLIFFILLGVSCTRKFYVAPETAECVIGTNSTCYLVKNNLDDNWIMIAEDIKGFDFEKGYIYRLKVKKIRIINDFGVNASAYQLVEIISKEPYKRKNKMSESTSRTEFRMEAINKQN